MFKKAKAVSACFCNLTRATWQGEITAVRRPHCRMFEWRHPKTWQKNATLIGFQISADPKYQQKHIQPPRRVWSLPVTGLAPNTRQGSPERHTLNKNLMQTCTKRRPTYPTRSHTAEIDLLPHTNPQRFRQPVQSPSPLVCRVRNPEHPEGHPE